MRLINKWRIGTMIGLVVIAIPIAARVSPTPTTVVSELRSTHYQQTTPEVEDAKIVRSNSSIALAGHRVSPPQDYYDRRREYWEDRMERRADHLEQEDGNDEDSADSEDSKDSAAGDDDDGGSMDEEEEMIEKRREYWRDRLDRDWD